MNLEIENLRFAYDGSGLVLRGIDMQASPGQITAIIGPNAAAEASLADADGKYDRRVFSNHRFQRLGLHMGFQRHNMYCESLFAFQFQLYRPP